ESQHQSLSRSGRASDQTKQNPSSNISSKINDLSCNDDTHDLVCAFQNLVHPSIAHQSLHRIILQITITAKELLRIHAGLKTQIRGHAFGHGAVSAGLAAAGVQVRGG